MQVVVIDSGVNKEKTYREMVLDYVKNHKDEIGIIVPEERKVENNEIPLDILNILEPEPKIEKSKSWDRKRKKNPWE